MKRVAASAHLPTPWLFEPAKTYGENVIIFSVRLIIFVKLFIDGASVRSVLRTSQEIKLTRSTTDQNRWIRKVDGNVAIRHESDGITQEMTIDSQT